MPTLVNCPSCQRQLRVPDNLLGQLVKCPTCNETFTAAAPPGEERAESVPATAQRADDDVDREYEEDRLRGHSGQLRRADALGPVKAPAICLLVASLLGLLADLLVMATVLAPSQPAPNEPDQMKQIREIMSKPIFPAIVGVFLLINLVAIAGAVAMLVAKARWLAIVGSVAALFNPTCCCALGPPFGIWSLVVLTRPEVKDAFQ
jgi:predicted Zn finger-like uncharacterized protein